MLVNSYLLSSYADGNGGRGVGQKAFPKKLISQLFEPGSEAQKQKRVISHTNTLRLASSEQHVRILRSRKQDYKGCILTGSWKSAKHLVRYQPIRAPGSGQGRPSMAVRPAISRYVKKALETLSY